MGNDRGREGGMEGLWEGVEGILIMMMMILRRLLAALDIDIDIPYVYTYRLPLFYVGKYSLGANASPSSRHSRLLRPSTTDYSSLLLSLSLSLPSPPPHHSFETVSFLRCCPHLPASATAEHAGLSNSRSPSSYLPSRRKRLSRLVQMLRPTRTWERGASRSSKRRSSRRRTRSSRLVRELRFGSGSPPQERVAGYASNVRIEIFVQIWAWLMLLLLCVVDGGWIFVRVFVGLLFGFDYEIFLLLLLLLDFGDPAIPVPIGKGEVEKLVVVVEVGPAVEVGGACSSYERAGNEERFWR